MSLSDRFRRGPMPDGWGLEGESSRVIALPSALFDDAQDDDAPVDDAHVDRAPEGDPAPDGRVLGGQPDPEPTLTERDDVVAAALPPTPGPFAPLVDPPPPTRPWAAASTADASTESTEPAVPVERPWLSTPAPRSATPAEGASGSPLLTSLAAALGAPDDTELFVPPAPSTEVGPAPEGEPEAPRPAEPEAAPAALPLASPAFARSKYGAMRRDEPRPDDRTLGTAPAGRAPVPFAPAVAPADPPRERGLQDAPIDPLASLKKRVEEALLRRIGSKLAEGDVSEDELRTFVERELAEVLASEQTALSKPEQEQIVSRLTDDLLGHGPMEQFLQDESVTEVMVSGLEPMYIERDGRLLLTDVRFRSEGQLRQVIERIVGRIGRRIDESSPMVDARLPDGSRVNAIIPPLSVDGPALTIRKFSRRALTVDDLVQSGSLSENASELLQACVRGRLNILVTGGTGSGKTTMLNVLSSFIPADQRIVTIEDAVELRLHQHHVIRLEARPSNIEGRGEVTIRDLMRNALRMRPDRIIVGEVRSGEALDMLQAMNTGHDGSLSTLHANQPRDALARLETMVLMAGFDLPVRAIREQMASAVDLIVHISRLRDGTRRVTHIVEVEGMEGEIITLTDLFLFDYTAGMDDAGRFRGSLTATGLRPKFTERLADQGIDVPLPVVGFDPRGEIAVPAGFGWNR